MGSWKGRGNQYIQFIRVLYCKLPTNGKQLPAFPLVAVPGIEPWPQRWEARVLPLCHRGPLYTVLEPPSQIWCTIHTTPSIIRGYRHWATCPFASTTVWGSYATLWYSGVMSIYLHLPYVAMLHWKTTESQPYKHRGLYLQLPLQEIHLCMLVFICTCSHYQLQRQKF